MILNIMISQTLTSLYFSKLPPVQARLLLQMRLLSLNILTSLPETTWPIKFLYPDQHYIAACEIFKKVKAAKIDNIRRVYGNANIFPRSSVELHNLVS